MIYGIGQDIVDISRIQKILLGKHNDAFLRRVLTTEERQTAVAVKKRLCEFVSGRFAAKEALAKAWGYGIGSVVGFQDIEVLPDRWGKPCVTLSPYCWSRLTERHAGTYVIHLTLSHEKTLVSAVAIIERADVHFKETSYDS